MLHSLPMQIARDAEMCGRKANAAGEAARNTSWHLNCWNAISWLN